MTSVSEENGIWHAVNASTFEIGGVDQLRDLKAQYPEPPEKEEQKRKLASKWDAFVKKGRIQIGTLLKGENIAFLLGAGASKHAGGVLLGGVPRSIEEELLREGISDGEPEDWLTLFYWSVKGLAEAGSDIPESKDGIFERRNGDHEPLPVNLEKVLSTLYRMDAAIPPDGQAITVHGERERQFSKDDIMECIARVKKSLAGHCELPRVQEAEAALEYHKLFLRKVLTRPNNLKRIDLFTLNYDTLVEQAADDVGVYSIDGFAGSLRRVFRPEAYDHDMFFPADTTEGRVHRLDRVVHLFKLHGSIAWSQVEQSVNNPYGVEIRSEQSPEAMNTLIYPTPGKYGEALGLPYSELFRRFASAIVRPQSTLIAIGYGFGDDHVNSIIRQALTIPSFTLVVVDPYPPEADKSSDRFIGRLRALNDQRFWLVGGETLAKFTGFVEKLLPDLRDEEISVRVTETHRALDMEEPDRAEGESEG